MTKQLETWDPIVRLTHWGIAAAVLLNGTLLSESGAVHVWIGYAAFGLLLLRLMWGLVGPREARFTAFPPSIKRVKGQLGDILAWRHRDYPTSHTPLGSLMVFALWAMIALVSITGIAMQSDPFPATEATHWATLLDDHDSGDEHEHDKEGPGEALEELHEAAATILLLLAAMHVAGVGLESRLSGRNLVKRMLPRRRPDG